jgi:hypothetical protein
MTGPDDAYLAREARARRKIHEQLAVAAGPSKACGRCRALARKPELLTPQAEHLRFGLGGKLLYPGFG